MNLPANIRVNLAAPFPSLVKGSGVVAVSKRNGIWTVALNFGALGLSQSVPDVTNTYVLVWNALTGAFALVPMGFVANRTAVATVKIADYAMALTDAALIFNGAAPITLTLLPPASVPGQWLSIKTAAAQPVVSASANVVPLAGGAAGTALLAGVAGRWARLQSLGGFWVIMEAN